MPDFLSIVSLFLEVLGNLIIVIIVLRVHSRSRKAELLSQDLSGVIKFEKIYFISGVVMVILGYSLDLLKVFLG